MKKEINPVMVVVAIVAIVAIAGAFLVRAATEKPAYPGLMAGHPGQGQFKPPPMAAGHMTPEMARQFHISGASGGR